MSEKQPAQAGQLPITPETGNTPDQGASAITAESGKAGQVLTDEQIQSVYLENMLYQDGLTPSGMVRVTRAIERAKAILAKRVPMTDAELAALVSLPWPDLGDLVRAVENHHGIVGKNGSTP